MENVWATDIRKATVCAAGASRFEVKGFWGWRRQWLRVLIAVQILCENLLLVDGAIATRKLIARQKRSWIG